mmetsp:Transcript_1102/g.2601  ORF Transcript_1102/g.2601 Transcript_1102/m.2601 type:complete len:234 (-) Transcript_1102:130-831(-)|eukprot:CAMPEP_0117575716 /NCGR_PEP_ID=MMETSP0784-20121206/62370_1 /TAXON_ID=39447 /ORGANISM="" /LENGTH=233 /DNA_ID=CAMNT_0005374835 /DNA_START=61 /DNA_END=762 /DNA_ORIENTATION=-
MDGGSGSWETLKGRAKCLKVELDAKMQELGQLNKRLGTAGQQSTASPGDRVATLDAQIQQVVRLRDEVERALGELADACEALSGVASTSAQAAQASRLRETQQELVRDFKRVSQSIEHQYQHARLLPGGSRSQRPGTGLDEAEDGLVREHGALDSSLRMADDIISQASSARDMLMNQNSMLRDVNSKVGNLTSMFPGVSSLIGKISDRKERERLILSGTVALCVCFTIWYKFF